VNKRLLVYCEGQTEELFVERILRPHLVLFQVKVERPVLAATTFSASCQRGGFVNWDAVAADLKRLFAADASPDLRFTTLLDVYAMPQKALDLAGLAQAASSVSDIEHLETAVERSLGEPRFEAYFQRHEIEALLLADMDAVKTVFHRYKTEVEQLKADIAGFANTEDIDHGKTTHPAARLARAIPQYNALKASNAYFVLAQAEMETVRARCPRFNEWLAHWEKWGSPNDVPRGCDE
jgi:hypothetical protein